MLFDYFQQLFAQVTNPPLDAIREELVTSLAATIGAEGNLLEADPESCRQIELPFPILDGGLILLLAVESIMRRDINIIVKERIYQAAFVVLIAFFAFIMFNDVSKLQMFNHLKP